MKKSTVPLIAALMIAFSASALADPPAHAPAHGWRKKHDPEYSGYTGYTGATWERDYDVSTGRCNRTAIGAVLGSVAGGVIGSKVASPENRTVGIIVGAVVGAVIGSKIGHELDEVDRGCFGHTLELGRAGVPVIWMNPTSGVRYTLVPGDSAREGSSCRNFTLEAAEGGKSSRKSGRACQSSPGVWKIG